MAYNFSQLNSSAPKKTVRDGISTSDLPESKIGEYVGKEIPVDGFFINDGKKGEWIVVISEGKKITSIPSQYVDTFKQIRDTPEALQDVMDGKLKLTNIRPYTTKAGNNTYLFDFESV